MYHRYALVFCWRPLDPDSIALSPRMEDMRLNPTLSMYHSHYKSLADWWCTQHLLDCESQMAGCAVVVVVVVVASVVARVVALPWVTSVSLSTHVSCMDPSGGCSYQMYQYPSTPYLRNNIIYRPREHIISQWWSQHTKKDGCTSWWIHSTANF